MLIPYQQLSLDALQGVIEEYISRDGTDYGAYEYSLEEKTTQVMQQLKLGQVLIVFDATLEQVTLLTKQEWQSLPAELKGVSLPAELKGLGARED